MSEVDVIAKIEGGVGRLTLNRPGVLHALTTGMCALMTDALLAWKADPVVEAVLVDHAGERGFCAGGDIRMLAESGAGDGAEAREFFFTEYRLNHLLFSYPKPVVAVMDGVTMGGGVGLSMPAKFRIATERTTFAMPETGIGLFPDVGGGWFLPRLPGHAGLWIALTGARIKAADCHALGIATHMVASADLSELKAALADSPNHIANALAAFETDPGLAPITAQSADIERLFREPSIEAIVKALEADGGDWAKSQLCCLATKSPQALKVALRQLREGARKTSFAAEMAVEYRIGARIIHKHDFLEGVRAVIIEKDNAPRWKPAALKGASESDLDAIFSSLPADQEWSPLPDIVETPA